MNPVVNKPTSESTQNTTDDNTEKPSYAAQRSKRCREQEEYSVSEQLDCFREEIKSMLSSFSTKQGDELKQVTTTLKEIQQINLNIENSVTYLTNQNEEFKKKIEELERKRKEDLTYITTLENKLEELQMSNRKSNIEIKNAPMKPKEDKNDLIEMVTFLGQKVECSISKTDIKDIYRVKGKKVENTNSTIIVELNSTILKTDLL